MNYRYFNHLRYFLIMGAVLAVAPPARACTNFLVTRGASTDGSTFITYAADSHTLYGDLVYRPRATHPPGSMRTIIDWDSGKRLGEIPQVPLTYAVVGNMNEYQVSVGETTFGGLKELHDPESKVDYGSLMQLALERAKTAREAVQVMTRIAETHGFASSGESFSVADPREVWILEMVGAGKGGKSAIWVARRIPDGYVSAHANQARIRKVPAGSSPDVLRSKNLVEFARRKGWYKGTDADFSFADTYAPLTFKALRVCEARVWSMFQRVSKDAAKYLDWVNGKDGAEPMPLWIKPDRKIAVADVMSLMRDHFEGTPFDMTKDVGAGPYDLPYRWRPLFWYADPACDECEEKNSEDVQKKKTCLKDKKCVQYVNERATATQQTGFSFVAQARTSLPDPIGGVFWFGVDDASSTVYVPLYAGLLRAPHAFAVGTGDWNRFSWDSAFWVFNVVANYAYSRYSEMIKDIRAVQEELEGSFLGRQAEVEAHALVLFKQSPMQAREYLTTYSEAQTARTVLRWRTLFTELVVKYLDGNTRDEQGKVTHPGYPKSWYRRLVKEKGEHLKVRTIKGEPPEELLD